MSSEIYQPGHSRLPVPPPISSLKLFLSAHHPVWHLAPLPFHLRCVIRGKNLLFPAMNQEQNGCHCHHQTLSPFCTLIPSPILTLTHLTSHLRCIIGARKLWSLISVGPSRMLITLPNLLPSYFISPPPILTLSLSAIPSRITFLDNREPETLSVQPTKCKGHWRTYGGQWKLRTWREN